MIASKFKKNKINKNGRKKNLKKKLLIMLRMKNI